MGSSESPSPEPNLKQRALNGTERKVTERERTQNADFRRKPQILADSPFLLEIPAFGGRRKPQKTADFRRKPQIFAENRRKPQIGLRHLRSVTFGSALKSEKRGVPSRTGGREFWKCSGSLKCLEL